MTTPLMASPSEILSNPYAWKLKAENMIRSGVDHFFRECIPTINCQISKTIEQMIAWKHSVGGWDKAPVSNIRWPLSTRYDCQQKHHSHVIARMIHYSHVIRRMEHCSHVIPSMEYCSHVIPNMKRCSHMIASSLVFITYQLISILYRF